MSHARFGCGKKRHQWFLASPAAILLAIFYSADLHAQSEPSFPVKQDSVNDYCWRDGYYHAECTEGSRFTTYEPVWAIFRRSYGDQNAFRTQYSFKFLLNAEPDCISAYRHERADAKDTISCLRAFGTRTEWYLMYTGEFDFYMTTRDSGPVVNRTSNPGAHVRHHENKPAAWGWKWEWWDVGFEHKSDGQVVNARDQVAGPNSPYKAQLNYDNYDHTYFDSISRDTNYLAVETRFSRYVKETDKLSIWLRVKPFYAWSDTVVTWGPYANVGIWMANFDIFRLISSYEFGHKAEVYGKWTVGLSGLKTDSLEIGITYKVGSINLPVYFQAHFGPLNNLSDYTQNQTMFGLGLRFDSYF